MSFITTPRGFFDFEFDAIGRPGWWDVFTYHVWRDEKSMVNRGGIGLSFVDGIT